MEKDKDLSSTTKRLLARTEKTKQATISLVEILDLLAENPVDAYDNFLKQGAYKAAYLLTLQMLELLANQAGIFKTELIVSDDFLSSQDIKQWLVRYHKLEKLVDIDELK